MKLIRKFLFIPHSFFLVWIVCAGMIVLLPSALKAQMNEYTVKAVFLERFTRFVRWPETVQMQDTTKPFVIGVIGENPFGNLLDQIYYHQRIKNKPVQIQYIKNLTEISDCHLLFISQKSHFDIKKIISITENAAILTVGDADDYSQEGVVINFYLENSKIRFEINESALRKSGLYMSHLLLKEAKIVQPVRGVQ